MRKAELIDFVKRQTGVELQNIKTDFMNNKRNVLYTQITRVDMQRIGRVLLAKGIKPEHHIKDYYFITI